MDLSSYTAFENNLGAYPYGSITRDYGPSDFNRKLRLTGSFKFKYQLPGPKRGAAHYALGGCTNGFHRNPRFRLMRRLSLKLS